MQELAIQKALTTLKFLSQDEAARRLYEGRQRALHDYVLDIEGAREEALEKGKEEGKAEKRMNSCRNS